MRASVGIVLGVASFALLSACSNKPQSGTAPAASPQAKPVPLSMTDLPHRKAGLWRQTMDLVGSGQKLPPVEACTDAASEAKLTLLGQHRSKDLCQSQDFARNPDGSITFTVSCDLGPSVGKTVSTGTITGNFDAKYQVEMVSRTTGAPRPQSNAERKMIMTATWVGPCAADERGGDIVYADGHKLNLTDPKPTARFR